MIHPAVIICVMIVLAILLLFFMVPTLTATFEGIGVELPASTRVLIYMSSFLVNHTLIVLGAIILPVIGEMIKQFESARTARTLSSLMSAGVEIVVAFDVTGDVMQNHLYKDVVKKARVAIEKGESMSQVFV